MAGVLAPPYDVISPAMQDELYEKSEYNVVRLILGKDEPGDNGAKNKYKRAKSYFDKYIKDGVLIRDDTPSIYVYVQEYKTPTGKKNRTGFIALMRLEDPEKSKVLPHERTFKNPKKDRLKLMRCVEANLSSIFTIFADDGNKVTAILEGEAEREPVFDVNYDGVRQRLWRVSDSQKISDVKNAMKNKQVFIADGHHRYETALAYRNEKRAKAKTTSGEEPHDYVMMYFASLDEARLTILPTHRVIKDIGPLTREEIIKRAGRYFEIRDYKNLKDLNAAQAGLSSRFGCGMYCGGSTYYLLELKEAADTDKIIRVDKSTEWKKLDVTLLHRFILKHILKIKENEGNIVYLRDVEAAVEKVKDGSHKLAFLLNPTKLEQVKQIAQTGEKMPHKSTYFYPKLLSGVVINKFD